MSFFLLFVILNDEKSAPVVCRGARFVEEGRCARVQEWGALDVPFAVQILRSGHGSGLVGGVMTPPYRENREEERKPRRLAVKEDLS